MIAKKLCIALLMAISCLPALGQATSYYPAVPGTSQYMRYFKTQVRVYYDGPVEKDGKLYIRENTKYQSGGISDTLLRVSNDTVYVFSETQKKEMVFFGIRPVIGEKIGYGKIIRTDASIKTPTRVYNDLLEIDITIPKNELWKRGIKYTLFFKKGVGFVGLARSGRLDMYLVE